MRVDKSGALEKSTDVTDIPVYEFNIALETTGGDVSFLNRKDGIHNRIIHNIVRASLIYSNQYAKNGVVRLKHPLKSIDSKFTMHWTTPHLAFPGMLNVLILMNSVHVDGTSIPSHQNIINWNTELKK